MQRLAARRQAALGSLEAGQRRLDLSGAQQDAAAVELQDGPALRLPLAGQPAQPVQLFQLGQPRGHILVEEAIPPIQPGQRPGPFAAFGRHLPLPAIGRLLQALPQLAAVGQRLHVARGQPAPALLLGDPEEAVGQPHGVAHPVVVRAAILDAGELTLVAGQACPQRLGVPLVEAANRLVAPLLFCPQPFQKEVGRLIVQPRRVGVHRAVVALQPAQMGVQVVAGRVLRLQHGVQLLQVAGGQRQRKQRQPVFGRHRVHQIAVGHQAHDLPVRGGVVDLAADRLGGRPVPPHFRGQAHGQRDAARGARQRGQLVLVHRPLGRGVGEVLAHVVGGQLRHVVGHQAAGELIGVAAEILGAELAAVAQIAAAADDPDHARPGRPHDDAQPAVGPIHDLVGVQHYQQPPAARQPFEPLAQGAGQLLVRLQEELVLFDIQAGAQPRLGRNAQPRRLFRPHLDAGLDQLLGQLLARVADGRRGGAQQLGDDGRAGRAQRLQLVALAAAGQRLGDFSIHLGARLDHPLVIAEMPPPVPAHCGRVDQAQDALCADVLAAHLQGRAEPGLLLPVDPQFLKIALVGRLQPRDIAQALGQGGLAHAAQAVEQEDVGQLLLVGLGQHLGQRGAELFLFLHAAEEEAIIDGGDGVHGWPPVMRNRERTKGLCSGQRDRTGSGYRPAPPALSARPRFPYYSRASPPRPNADRQLRAREMATDVVAALRGTRCGRRGA
ncbi:MAG: hypothetical protein BWY52_02844 [Chloroflexi bacterium ADurb.Bin325]|nr:MAG: hypothetical protein BWY52_02844 [Chloroflexi bacterium ADurb.Bin325]